MNPIAVLKKPYTGINKNIWILATAMFINRCGSMVLLFMSVYLIKNLHFTISQAGIVMAMFGLGSLLGAFIGGRLVDKVGYFPILVGSLLISGLMLVLLGSMQTFASVAFVTFLVTATGDAFRPANSASISSYSEKENYTQAIGLNRLAMNLGFMIGPMLGGFLASINYHFLFWTDGLTTIAAGTFLLLVLPKPNGRFIAKKEHLQADKNEQEKVNNPYKNKRYLFFLVCASIYATAFFQFFTAFPIYYKDVYALNERQIGWLMALNGFGVAVVEMFLISYIQNKWTILRFISLGILLVGVSFLILIPFHGIYILIISMILVTFSEMFAMPFMNTFAINQSSPNTMGQYMALYSMSWSVAQIAAPILGTKIIDNFGYNTLWVTLFALSLLAFAGILFLEKTITPSLKNQG